MKFSHSYSQRDLPEWEAVFQWYNHGEFSTTNTLYLEPVKIFRDGNLLEEGIVSSPVQPSLFDGFRSTAKILGYNNLGLLWTECSANLHFQDVLVSNVINTLLPFTVNTTWALVQDSTFQDIEVTVDLRNEENLWSQLEKTVKESRYPTYLRYGGLVAGVHQLVVGTFGEQNPAISAIQGKNVISPPKIKLNAKEIYREIHPISGRSSDTPVDVSDALNYDPNFALDPNYPLVGDTVVNNNVQVGKGLCRVKEYNIHKSANDVEATQQEKNEVAASVVRRAQRDLQASEPSIDLELDIILTTTPVIHDGVFTSIYQVEGIMDEFSGYTNRLTTFNIQQVLRITEWEGKYTERYTNYDTFTGQILSVEQYSMSLSSGTDLPTDDPLLVLGNKLEKYDTSDNALAGIGLLQQDNVTVTHSAVATDCISGATNGKLFSFPLPAIHPDAAQIQWKLISITDNVGAGSYSFSVTQTPTIGGNTLILCVFDAGGWTIADDVTIVIRYLQF